MGLKSILYGSLKYSNDANAVKKDKVGRRIGRRIYGKASGKLARKFFG